MAELSADAEREVRNFLEEVSRLEEERRHRFVMRLTAIAGVMVAGMAAALAAMFYFFVDSVETSAKEDARQAAQEMIQAQLGTIGDIVDTRARINSAEVQARDFELRAQQILERLPMVRDHANQKEGEINALAPLFGIGANVTELKTALATDVNFQTAIRGGVDPAPTGLVAAYVSRAGIDDTGNHCPDGWSPFEEARGRVVVGAGQAKAPLRTRAPYSAGGAEEVTLTEAQMPSHSHQYDTAIYPRVTNLINRYANLEDPKAKFGNWWSTQQTTSTGADMPHPNMPPYIALYFCKKD